MEMAELRGLPGTDGKPREAIFVRSMSGVRKALARAGAATAAGDNGAINIWQDDEGQYRGELQRYMRTMDSMVVTRQADIKPYFDRWYEAIQ